MIVQCALEVINENEDEGKGGVDDEGEDDGALHEAQATGDGSQQSDDGGKDGNSPAERRLCTG